MTTVRIPATYRHYYYDPTGAVIWYTTEELSEIPEGWEYLGASNNPIPQSAATAFSQRRGDIKGCKVRARV